MSIKGNKPSDMWSTPDWVIDFALKELGINSFDLDVACLEETAKAENYCTPNEDGLKQPWYGFVWCNPPYSDITPWLEKAIKEQKNGVTSCFLLNADHTTKWYKTYSPFATRVNIPKRIKFIPPAGLIGKNGKVVQPTTNPFPSMLLIFYGNITK